MKNALPAADLHFIGHLRYSVEEGVEVDPVGQLAAVEIDLVDAFCDLNGAGIDHAPEHVAYLELVGAGFPRFDLDSGRPGEGVGHISNAFELAGHFKKAGIYNAIGAVLIQYVQVKMPWSDQRVGKGELQGQTAGINGCGNEQLVLTDIGSVGGFAEDHRAAQFVLLEGAGRIVAIVVKPGGQAGDAGNTDGIEHVGHAAKLNGVADHGGKYKLIVFIKTGAIRDPAKRIQCHVKRGRVDAQCRVGVDFIRDTSTELCEAADERSKDDQRGK